MEITVTSKYIRISPTKLRLVANAIKMSSAEKALGILKFINKGGGKPMLKLLKSAIANAKNNYSISIDTLYIKEARVDCGPSLKRIQPRAQGRADRIIKRTSHISLKLAERV